MSKYKSLSQAGFSAVEGLLILVIIAGVVGVGVYVAKHRASSTTTANSSQPLPASKVGTVEGIDQLNTQEDQSEEAITTKHETSEQQAATSANTSATNIGGAYDESSL